MPSLNKHFLHQLQDDYKQYSCFIETGTFGGDTIFALEPYFDKLYTIEFNETYYDRAKNKYNGNKINFILGDSSIVFESLLRNIGDKSIFFLDGHWCGGNSGRSSKDCPLYEEITHINNLFKNEAIIIIDDFRLFGLDETKNGGQNWGEINKEKILDILKSRINKFYHIDSECAKDDRLIIHINAI